MTVTAPPPETTEADAELAEFRDATAAIAHHQGEVDRLSKRRMTLLLALRRRTPPPMFSEIAEAVGTTEGTIYKIHREARRAEEAGKL